VSASNDHGFLLESLESSYKPALAPFVARRGLVMGNDNRTLMIVNVETLENVFALDINRLGR
jgi:hypothetical protein